MNKAQLIEAMALKTGDSKKATAEALDAFVDVVSDAMKNGNKVQLVGFGTFETRNRAARKGHNPQTGAELKIAACKAPAFKPGKALKDIVNK